jgi:hypothetical protein
MTLVLITDDAIKRKYVSATTDPVLADRASMLKSLSGSKVEDSHFYAAAGNITTNVTVIIQVIG